MEEKAGQNAYAFGKEVSSGSVHMGFHRRHRAGPDHRLDLWADSRVFRRFFYADGQHGGRPVRDGLGAVHRAVLFLSGMGAVRHRAGGGSVRVWDRMPERKGEL